MHNGRPRQPIFLAKWWLSPQGYELRTGDFDVGGRRLVTCNAPGGGFFLQSDEFADDFPWNPRERGDYDEKPEEPWIVAPQFSERSTDSLGWLGTFEQGLITYEPLKVRGLHRDFAALSSDPDAILAFASRFGFLGDHTWEVDSDSTGESLGFVWAETIRQWQEQANRLRLLIDLWDAFRSAHDQETFWDYIEVDTDCVLFSDEARERYAPLPGPDVYWDEYTFPHVPEGLEPEPLGRRAARTMLRGAVSSALSTNAAPWFDLGPGGQVSIAPSNLLGAIYVHFLQELLGRSDPLFRCASCGKWFVQRHGGRIYCNQACKQKAYRRGLKKGSSNGK